MPHVLVSRNKEKSMTCSQIYLGPGRFAAPLAAEYWNSAIAMTSYDLPETAATVSVAVTASNHGSDDSPSTTIELYWSDPTTGFMAVASRRINGFSHVIPGATIGPGGGDGTYTQNFFWSVDSTVWSVNGGHVCLLARMANDTAPAAPCTQQFYDSSSPATDPLSAIHNVQFHVPPPPPGPPPGGGGGGPGPGQREWMAFGFAATNILKHTDDTKLEVRVLDPARDREKLQSLVAIKAVDRALACRGLKFGVPKSLHLAAGREGVIVPRTVHEGTQCLPRLGKLGPTTFAQLKHLALPGTKPMEVKGPVDLKLLHGEMRQMFAVVEPCERERVVYAVEVSHSAAKGENIGGLVILFVPPHDYF
jgi:hypothetical protein